MKILQRHPLILLPALLALFLLTACGGSDDSTGPGGQRNAPSSITVLADSSLKSAFTQIGKDFEDQNAGSTVNFTWGTSADLSQQAVDGDPGDVLATTDQQSMVAAEKVQISTPRVFAMQGSNQCQIVTLQQSKNTSLSNQFINQVLNQSSQQALRQAGFAAP